MRLSLVSRPTTEPLTLQEAKDHLRVDGTDEDALISAFITAARLSAEHETGLTIAPVVYELIGETLPESIELPKPPFIQILSIKYQTEAGETELANTGYTIVEGSYPTELLIDVPTDLVAKPNGVRIRYEAGYEMIVTAIDEATQEQTVTRVNVTPEDIKSALKLTVGDLFAHRENTVVGSSSFANELPFASRHLLHPYRVYSF